MGGSDSDKSADDELKCEVVKSVVAEVPRAVLQGASHLTARFKTDGIFGKRALYTRRALIQPLLQQATTGSNAGGGGGGASSDTVKVDLGALVTGFPMSKQGLNGKKWEVELKFIPAKSYRSSSKGKGGSGGGGDIGSKARSFFMKELGMSDGNGEAKNFKVQFPDLEFGKADMGADKATRTVQTQAAPAALQAALPWLRENEQQPTPVTSPATITVTTVVMEKEEDELETAPFSTLCQTRIKWSQCGDNGDGALFLDRSKLDKPVHVTLRVGLESKELPAFFPKSRDELEPKEPATGAAARRAGAAAAATAAPTSSGATTAAAASSLLEVETALPFVWEFNSEEPKPEHEGECTVEFRHAATDKHPFKVYSYHISEYAKTLATAWPVRDVAGTFAAPPPAVFSLPALPDDKIKVQSPYTKLFPAELKVQVKLSALSLPRKVRMKVKSLLQKITDVGQDMAAQVSKNNKKKENDNAAGAGDGAATAAAAASGDVGGPTAALEQLKQNLRDYEAALEDEDSDEAQLAKNAQSAAGAIRQAGDQFKELASKAPKMTADQIAGKLQSVEQCVRAFKASIKNPFVDPSQAFQVVMEDILPAAQAADIANKMAGAFDGLKKFHSALIASAGNALGTAIDLLAPVASAALNAMGSVLGELGSAVAGVAADIAQAIPFVGMFVAPLISIAKKVYAQYNLMKEADEERETLLGRLSEHFEWFKRYQDFTKLLEKRGAQVRKLLAKAQLLIADCFDEIEADKSTGAGMRFVTASGRKERFVSLRAELDSTFALVEKEIEFGFMFETLESVKEANAKIDEAMKKASKEAREMKRMIKELGSAIAQGDNDLRRRAREIPDAYKDKLVQEARAKLGKCDRSVHPEMMNEVQSETGRMLRFPVDLLYCEMAVRRFVEIVVDEEVDPLQQQQQQQQNKDIGGGGDNKDAAAPVSAAERQMQLLLQQQQQQQSQQQQRDLDRELMEGTADLLVNLDDGGVPEPMMLGGMLIAQTGMQLVEQQHPAVELQLRAQEQVNNSYYRRSILSPPMGPASAAGSGALHGDDGMSLLSPAGENAARRNLLLDNKSQQQQQQQALAMLGGGELQDLDVVQFSERIATSPPPSRVAVLEASSGLGKSVFAKMLCLKQKFPGFVAVYLSLSKLVNSSSSSAAASGGPPNASAFWRLLRRAATTTAMSDLFVTIVEERNVPVVWVVDDLELVQTNEEAKNFLFDFVDPVNRANALLEQAEMLRQLKDPEGNNPAKKGGGGGADGEDGATAAGDGDVDVDAEESGNNNNDPAKQDRRSSRGHIVRPEDLVIAVMRDVHLSAGESCDFFDPAAPAQRWTLSPWDPSAIRRLPYRFFGACKLRDAAKMGATVEETLKTCPAFTKSPFFAQLLCELTVRGGPTAEMIKRGTLRANATQLLQLVVKESWDRKSTLNKITDRYSAAVRSEASFDIMVRGAGSHALKYMRGHETLEFPVSIAPDNWAWLLTQADLTVPAGYLQRVFIDMAYVEYFAAEYILRNMKAAIRTIPWDDGQRVVWLHLATLLAEDTDRFDERDMLVEAVGHNVAVKYAALSVDRIAVRYRPALWAQLRRDLALNLLCEVAEILDAGYNKIPHPARALMGASPRGNSAAAAAAGSTNGSPTTAAPATAAFASGDGGVADSTPLTGNARHLKPGQMLSYTFEAVMTEFNKQRESDALLSVQLPTLSKVSEWIARKMPSAESMGKVGDIIREAKAAGRRAKAHAAAHANKLENPWMMWCLEPCVRAGCMSGVAWLEENVSIPDPAWAEAVYASFEARPELIATLLKKGARVDLERAVKLGARRAVRRIVRANRLEPGSSGMTTVSGIAPSASPAAAAAAPSASAAAANNNNNNQAAGAARSFAVGPQQQQQQHFDSVSVAGGAGVAGAGANKSAIGVSRPRPAPLNRAAVAGTAAAAVGAAASAAATPGTPAVGAVSSPNRNDAAIAEAFTPAVEELMRVPRANFCAALKAALKRSAQTRQAEIALELLGGAALSQAGRAAIGAGLRCVRDGPDKIALQLTHLDLRECGLRTDGAMELFEAPLPALRLLSLERNAIGPRAFEYFARVGKANLPKLEQISLAGNFGCLVGVLLVAKTIAEMPTMRFFDVSRNTPREHMRPRYTSPALKSLLFAGPVEIDDVEIGGGAAAAPAPVPARVEGKLDARLMAPQIVSAALASPGIDAATYSEPYTYDVVCRLLEWLLVPDSDTAAVLATMLSPTSASASAASGPPSPNSPKAQQLLPAYLRRTEPLKRLSLSGSQVGVGGMRFLMGPSSFPSSSGAGDDDRAPPPSLPYRAVLVGQLVELDLSDCGIDAAALQVLFSGIAPHNAPLWETLTLASNPTIGQSEGGVMALAELLKLLRDSPLKSLNLRDCALGGGGAGAGFLDLRGALRVQKGLRALDLSNNAMSDVPVVFSIVADIQPNLRQVNLSRNGLCVVETEPVAVALRKLTKIENVDLSFNPIDDTTVKQLRKKTSATIFFQ